MSRPTESIGVLQTAAQTAASIGTELSATLDGASELARVSARLANQRAHERPWHLALVVGVIGLLAGLSMRRR